MTTYERPIGFEDVDAAGLLFFGRYFGYCHEAMERLFGTYVDLIMRRRIGFPAVHVEADFKAPLAYGDVARIGVSVVKLGTTSCTLRYDVVRARDGVTAATITHVVVAMDLATKAKVPIPEDCRALLEAARTA